jgi:F-type H+-transporting ATPase subunit b
MLETLSKVGFDWQVALANFVNFVIIFLVLKKFAFGPILKIINERQHKINQGLEEAEKARTNLLMSEETGKEYITNAKKDANSIIIEARQKGDNIISELKNEAIELKSNIIKEGEQQVENKKNSLRKELEVETSEIIVNGIEKILKNKLTREQEQNYIESFLSNKL